MPLFFFHYRTADGYEVDDVGGEFASLELAFLDAHRGAIDIAAELLRAGKNPMRHCIDVADAEGHVLMDLPFREVLMRKVPLPCRELQMAGDQALSDLRVTFARSNELRAAINTVCDDATATLEIARGLLRRAAVLLGPRDYMLNG